MQNVEVLSLMQNNLELNYSILAFSTLHVRSLYYQINQNEWNEASAQSRTLKLAALAPGKYRINFRFGLQGEPFEALSFQIMKPWWQQGWFQFVWAFIAILLVYIFYRYQMRRIRKRNAMMLETIKLEQSLNQSILSSIKSQMNPHFFYNALNTIQSFIYSNDKANASHYLTRFSKLTRMILEMSEKDKIALQEEIDALNLYLEIERARFDDTFEYSIQVMDSVDMELTKIPSMIVQPYVENAIKHGLLHLKGKKILNLNFDRVDGALQVIIDDNGIGRNRSYELERIKNTNHNSFATKANEKRLEILNRGKQHKSGVTYIDKLDSQGIPAGTRVILTLYDA